MWEEMGSSFMEQSTWNHLMFVQERVETGFPGAEGVGTMCCLCAKGAAGVSGAGWNHNVSLWEWAGHGFPAAEVWGPCDDCAEWVGHSFSGPDHVS